MTDSRTGQLTRRSLFGLGASAAVGAVGALGAEALIRQAANGSANTLPFYDTSLSGVTAEAQTHTYFVIFDVQTETKSLLLSTLRRMCEAAGKLADGSELELGFGTQPIPEAPPADTGEAAETGPARLSFLIGYGRSFFARFAEFETLCPAALLPTQTFAHDELQESQTGGDICLQICADDEQVAFHAARNLIRISKGVLIVRHMQQGFLPAREPGNRSAPRNLFGFKDGSANLDPGNSDEMSQHVWVGSGDSDSIEWMTGGTYLAYRQFSFRIETWDRSSLAEQEQIFGRDKHHGAPLSIQTPTAKDEFTAPDLSHPAIDTSSHMALAHSSRNGGAKILRRAYNFSNGLDQLGRMNAGLLFISFQRSLADQFVPIQKKLAAADLMNEYVVTTGSAYFAVPKAPATGSYWGAEFSSGYLSSGE